MRKALILPPASMTRPQRQPRHFWKHARTQEALALLLCIVAGVLVSTLPHIVYGVRTGSPVWIADDDELLYLAVASQAYYNHPTGLSDPLLPRGGGSIFQWLQFGPGVLAARWLHLDPMHISILWRVWAGFSIGSAWFLIFKLFIGRVGPALCLSLILIGDTGLLTAKPVLRQFGLALQILFGRSVEIFSRNPQIHVQWRLITPGLSLAFLLLHVWLLGRARETPSRTHLILSGVGFGLLFPIYFYFWTAATVALSIAFVLDRGCRRIYVHTFWIGLLFGLPTLLSSYLLKRSNPPDWLIRSDNFLPIGHFSELLFPKGPIVLLIVLGIWVLSRRKDMTYIWCLALAALLLTNNQILTGLQIQNFHWIYAWGPCLSGLALIAVWDMAERIGKFRFAAATLIALCIVHLAIAFSLRIVEATQTKESLDLTNNYKKYAAQRAKSLFRANAVVAGSMDFVNPAVVVDNLRPLDHYCAIFSPSLTDLERDRRIALNSYLEGLDRTGFQARQLRLLSTQTWGIEARDVNRRNERLRHRLAEYDSVAAEPETALRQFAVGYVAVKMSQAPPPYIKSAWTLAQDGPFWQVWAFPKPYRSGAAQ